RLVALGGVSATGKSTLAYALAPFLGAAPGAIVLRSDLIRKRLMGVDELAHLPAEAYAPEVTRRVYAEMIRLAGELVAAGCSVIADAVHGSEAERMGIDSVARKAGVPFFAFWLDAAPHVLEARVAERTEDASDATVEILRQQLTSVSSPENWSKLDASAGAQVLLSAARAQLGKWSRAGGESPRCASGGGGLVFDVRAVASIFARSSVSPALRYHRRDEKGAT